MHSRLTSAQRTNTILRRLAKGRTSNHSNPQPKRAWLTRVLTFAAGVATTLTFFVTIVMPTARKEIVPLLSPNSLLKVQASIITDMHNVDSLEREGRTPIVLDALPIAFRITNMSEFPLVIDEI